MTNSRPTSSRLHAVRARRAARVAVLGLLLAALSGAPRASQVRARTLPEMVSAAGTIFAGRVVSVEAGEVHGLPVSRVTFEIDENLRGAAGERLTLTFPGGTTASGFPYRFNGLRPFAVGDEVVLLAYAPSPVGLTSPVGLYQGRFDVRPGPAGLATVVAAGPRPGNLGGPRPLDAAGPAPADATATARAAPGSRVSPLSASTAGPRVYARGEFLEALRRLVDEQAAAADVVTPGAEPPDLGGASPGTTAPVAPGEPR